MASSRKRPRLKIGDTPHRRESAGEHWRQLAEFVRLICWSGFVANGRPQSVFLLAEPGQGKTELLERFRINPQLDFYSDVTFQRLLPALRQAQHGRLTHIVITEFQKIVARRRAVAESTLTLFLQAMEEGVYHVGYGPVSRDFGGARFGLLAASTVRSIEKHPYLISDLAMDSRAFFIDARSSMDEIRELEQLITDGDRSTLEPIKVPKPDRKVEVHVPRDIGSALMEWVEEMRNTKGVRTYNARTLQRFRFTAQGVALSNGREKVTKADLEQLYSFAGYWLRGIPLPDDY